jgi:hypothetical protein
LGLVLVGHEGIGGHNGFWLPFSYCVEREADLIILRRLDGSYVAAFGALGVALSEVELAVWEDAD